MSPAKRPSTPGTSPDERGADPTELSRWRPLRLLLAGMDADLAGIYDERGLGDVRPRFVMPLIRLAHRGPLTIRALATSLAVSHSAMSQTVTALRRAGYVDSAAGTDARTREITLTAKGRALVPFLEDEWRATEAAVADIEAEVPYPLSQVVTDLAAALATRSFHDRVSERLGQTAHV